MAGLIIANNVKRLTEGLAAATTAWKTLESRRLALETEEVTGFSKASGPTRPILRGTQNGIACTVSIVSDKVQYAHTRISAKAAQASRAKVGVHPSPAGILGTIRSWIGQDIEIGDADFDEAFLITGKPDEAAKALLTETIRERIVTLAAARLAGFTFEDGEVVVLLHGVETDCDLLGVALDLVADAAKTSV